MTAPVAVAEAKFCRGCREHKASAEFPPNRQLSGGRATYCRPCTNERRNAYYHRRANGKPLPWVVARPPEIVAGVAKECWACRTIKPISDYNKNKCKPDGLQNYCRECGHFAYIASKYRVSRDTYSVMLAKQAGKCAICGHEGPRNGRMHFDVDHCHLSGRVRGLLCWDCNTGIGKLQDSPAVLRQAIRYLQQVAA